MNSVVSSFINSGVGLALSMVHFSPSIEQQKQIYICEAKDVGVVCKQYNKRINRLRVYRRLSTNCWHGKAAELPLAIL